VRGGLLWPKSASSSKIYPVYAGRPPAYAKYLQKKHNFHPNDKINELMKAKFLNKTKQTRATVWNQGV